MAQYWTGWISKKSAFLGLFLFIIWTPMDAYSNNQELLSPIATGRRAYQTDPKVKQQKLVTFNPAYLMSRTSSPKEISLFDDQVLALENLDFSTSHSGITTMSGKVVDYPQSEVFVTWQNDVAAATINTGLK
ncbi:MAG: hypothetical protein AAGD96_24775, partial [Chloroflexota bacterium]